MDSVKYWKEAALEREAAVHLEAKAQIERMLKLYEDAYRDIQTEIEKIRYNYSLRFGLDKETAEWFLSREINKRHMDELAELLLKAESDEERRTILEFIHKDGLSTRAYGARAGRYKELEDVISLRMLALQAEVREIGKSIIKTAYKNNYYRLIDDAAFGLDAGVSFTLIDDDALEAVMNKPWYGKRFSERVWKNTQKLADEAQEIVGRYIVSGRSQDKAIRELRDRFDVAESRATTLIRTEMAHARSQGDLKGYGELGVEYYIYMATLDERTCDICSPLDGQRFMVSEAAEGKNYPVMHPRCRCTTTIDMKWTSRRARNPVTGHNDVIDGSVTYEQWRDGMNPEEKAAFEAARREGRRKASRKKTLTSGGDGDIIKNIEIDDIYPLTYNGSIKKEVVETIDAILKDRGTSRMFDGAKIVKIAPTEPLQTAAVKKGTFFDTVLNINENALGGKTLQEIDNIFKNSATTVANNLREGIIHEEYHAMLIQGMSYAQVERLYDELAEIHIDGISPIAYKDGAECIAEIGVLLERKEINKIPKKAMEFFNKYMEGEKR